MNKQELKDQIHAILYSDMTAAKMLEAIEKLIDEDDESES